MPDGMTDLQFEDYSAYPVKMADIPAREPLPVLEYEAIDEHAHRMSELMPSMKAVLDAITPTVVLERPQSEEACAYMALQARLLDLVLTGQLMPIEAISVLVHTGRFRPFSMEFDMYAWPRFEGVWEFTHFSTQYARWHRSRSRVYPVETYKTMGRNFMGTGFREDEVRAHLSYRGLYVYQDSTVPRTEMTARPFAAPVSMVDYLRMVLVRPILRMDRTWEVRPATVMPLRTEFASLDPAARFEIIGLRGLMPDAHQVLEMRVTMGERYGVSANLYEQFVGDLLRRFRVVPQILALPDREPEPEQTGEPLIDLS
jgi:hypothetical protein